MKVCILSAVNIKHMSLISLYTDILNKHGIEYDIIYMDKYGEEETFHCNKKYRYVNKIRRNLPSLFKMIKYMTFLPYATRILNREKYDFVIVWNDVAIFMFADYLARKYKGRYCLNVRDNMGYDKKTRKHRYEKVFKNAAFRTVSSKAYLNFLPQNLKYIPIYGINLSALKGMNIHSNLRQAGESIRIGFIGYVRYFERNKQMLDVFANDERFELHYYGTGADILKKYADENGIKNTVFHDSFPVEDTKKYLEKIDIINNLYGNDSLNVRNAVSIKFFHALYAKIPILVCDNTYVGTLAKDLGMGFEVCEINCSMKENLYDWYTSLNFQNLSSACDRFLQKAMYENEVLEDVFMECLNDKSPDK